MSFDGVFTHAMVNELTELLANGRVSKIHQPYQNEIILVMRANGKNQKVLLSAHPSYARIQLTEIPYENPDTPPQFCMMMRKHLEGAILENIEQVENDRIIRFLFKSRDEIGDVQNVMLVVELMGRHSNIFLIEQDTLRILDSIKHIPSSQNSYRLIMPGATYKSPPHQDKLNPFTVSKDTLTEIIQAESELPLGKQLQAHFQGLGSDTVKELIQLSEEDATRLPSIFQDFFTRIEKKEIQPTKTQLNNKELFTPLPYTSLEGTQTTYAALSQLLDDIYRNKAEKDRVKQQAANLFHVLQTELARNKKKLTKLQRTLDETEHADDYRVKGEILTAYLHELTKGQESAELQNFYDDNNLITISLDPRKTPSQNAQKYFSKYQKLKNAVIYVNEQMKQTREEIDYLDSIMTQLELATPKDVAEIKEELIQEGYLKKKSKKKQKKQKASKPDQYQSSDGTTILVGKNNLQNDQLTLKTARKSEIWLHTKDIPGSHVIIQDSEPSETTLLEAANLAAYFSKSRLSASVPVDYVEVKKIRKPNGAKPGFVIYEGQQTVFVTPDEELVNQLKM
ncbi:NFACT family protein [Desemzia sp. RIT804]|uniref:NFACT RNA binding domain-containing protein n=1 Tax=Desemzia sp. RIT 804 TaxID=2810209 RepID=UPI00194FC5EF|nr:NFACT RNA binding domain-containing protein [Desemzia sp. RIT 804]MBM6613799.1 NFACT family protein [Desemzia sp. RIT 804]